MPEESLINEIEMIREQLNKEAWSKPLFSNEVVQLSKKLDSLLNKYDSYFAKH